MLSGVHDLSNKPLQAPFTRPAPAYVAQTATAQNFTSPQAEREESSKPIQRGNEMRGNI